LTAVKYPRAAVNHPTIQRALQDAQSGKLDGAIASLRSLLRMQPKNTEAMQVLGLLLTQAGQREQAIVQLERAVQLEPQAASFRNNLGNALLDHGRARDAALQFSKAVELDRNYFRAFLGLALARTALHDSVGAIDACRRGLALKTPWPEMSLCAAAALESGDMLDEAITCLREGLSHSPSDERILSRLALALNYTCSTPHAIHAAHLTYRGAIRREPCSPPKPVADPDRPLRIGVLSGDLRAHSVGYFAEPFFRARPDDHAITVFATNPPDAGTLAQRFRSLAGGWVECAALSDKALDEAIRTERIDVLIELSGHTKGGRLPALDRKPAPVIVSALGYPNTTGHPSVDWRIVDSVTDPLGAEAFCTERLLRIDPCFLCYEPSPEAPEPTAPPPTAPFTFGSFNLSSKISESTIALWTEVLKAVPQARLLVKSKSIADESTRNRLLERLASGGVDPARIETLAYTATQAEHFALYGRVHVALDTTPYNGTTTTCEALWMGVPVVTLEGDRHAARVGASLLRAAGRPELVARDPADFVEIAARLAQERGVIDACRQGAREKLRSSALLGAPAYGARFHAAIRQAWRSWCEAQARA
jgi:predicted O-linked N-acetylglucosamine transferase (SPINDLY family)